MERYSDYKPTSMQWLKEIPSHWGIPRLKRIMTLTNGRAYLQPELLYEGKYRILRVGNLFTNEKWYYSDLELEENKYCNDGDLLFAWSASFGPYIWHGEKTIYHYHIWKVDVKKQVVKKYAFYLLKYMSDVKRRDVHGSAMVHLTMKDMNDTKLPIPPLSEQEKIVSYLESKTSKIDAYVADKEKEIQLLQELKQKTIAEAVTKGLNPNVKMKDSGISWLGMIPEHWEVSRMKRIFSESKEKTTDESGILLSLSQYTGITLKDNAKKVGMFEAESTIGYNIVHPGQFVMNIMLAWNGSYAVSDYEGIISPSYCVFNFNEDCERKYFHYLLRLPSYAGAFKTMSKGIIESRLRLYPLYFFTFKTIIPPLDEQRAIVSYIEEKCQKIDTLITELQAEIDHLKEYKQRLIADVVTGQVNVQNLI